MAACSREGLTRRLLEAEGGPARSQVEMEHELQAARMLLVNTFPQDVCEQLTGMYRGMIQHAQGTESHGRKDSTSASSSPPAAAGNNAPPPAGSTGGASSSSSSSSGQQQVTKVDSSTSMDNGTAAAAGATTRGGGNACVPLRWHGLPVYCRATLEFSHARLESAFADAWAAHLQDTDPLLSAAAAGGMAATTAYPLALHLSNGGEARSAALALMASWLAAVAALCCTMMAAAWRWPTGRYGKYREPMVIAYRVLLAGVACAACLTLRWWLPASGKDVSGHVSGDVSGPASGGVTALPLLVAAALPALALRVRLVPHLLTQLAVLLVVLAAEPLLLPQALIEAPAGDTAAVELPIGWPLLIVALGGVAPTAVAFLMERSARVQFLLQAAPGKRC